MKLKLPAATGGERAFSRVDLIAVVGLVLFLGGWFITLHRGERGRTARCAGNLHDLGKALREYAQDHNDALPAALITIGKVQTAWDRKLFPYLKPGLAKANSDQLFAAAPQFFLCPSDTAPHSGKPRSYAMAGNNMRPQNWPPGPHSATGVGLVWYPDSVVQLLGAEALHRPEALPVVKFSDVPVPTDTLLLTELIDPGNVMGGLNETAAFGTVQQRQSFADNGAQFHRGRFNYLMVDGHVEALSPLQTGAMDETTGIWSLRKEK